MIAIGSQAPDFKLLDQNKKVVKLSRFKGKKVILSFRPLAWTPICHDQMQFLENNFERMAELNTVAFGIGVDSSPSNKAWADTMGIKRTRLLADFWPHGEVAKAYGVLDETEGYSTRSNIIIDESQKVMFTKVYPFHELPDIDELIAFIEKH